MLDVKIASVLGQGQVSSELNVAAASTFFADTVPVQSDTLWYVERLVAMLQTTFTGAGPFASGDSLSLSLLPPASPVPETGNIAGQVIVAARGIILAEIDLAAVDLAPTNEGDTINYGGVNQVWLATLRMVRPCIVPSTWNLRAIANLSGNSGGLTAAILTVNYEYALVPRC